MKQFEITPEETAIRQRLYRRVEEVFGQVVTTPSRFEALSASIFERTGVQLSPTTLKRLWGYLHEPVAPRLTTLDALARYAGWGGFEAFTSGERSEIESGNVGTASRRAGSARDGRPPASPSAPIGAGSRGGRGCYRRYPRCHDCQVVELGCKPGPRDHIGPRRPKPA